MTVVDSTRSLSQEGDEPGPRRRPQLHRVMHCRQLTAAASRHDLDGVTEIHLGRGATTCAERDSDNGNTLLRLHIADASVSTDHARIVRDAAGYTLRDQDSKNGCWLNGERVAGRRLYDGALIEIGGVFFLYRNVVTGGSDASPDMQAEWGPFATLLPALELSLERAKRVAAGTQGVLLTGETGTGKEIVARAIHRCSGRRGPFVAVNCATLVDGLVEAQLFGHSRGAFTGAEQDRAGLIATADGGTLFLDEVAELSSAAQATLLRVLEEREVRAVGATEVRPVDIRVLAATQRDIEALVAGGRFRRDLFARLAGYRVELPPLRERRSDLGLIVGKLAADLGYPDAQLSSKAARALFRHDWPLNLRELREALHSALLLGDNGLIQRKNLPNTVLSARPPSAQLTTAEERRVELLALLEQHRGNLTHVAKHLGKQRQQVQRWCRSYGIDPSQFRNR